MKILVKLRDLMVHVHPGGIYIFNCSGIGMCVCVPVMYGFTYNRLSI